MKTADTATSSRRSKDADRIVLVDHLWKLKKHWQAHTGTHVPLNVLIKEPRYREDVLQGAQASGNATLVELAGRIKDIEKHLPADSILPKESAPQDNTPSLLKALVLSIVALVGLVSYIAYDAWNRDPNAYYSQLPTTGARTLFRLHGSNTVGEKLAPALLTSWFEERNALETATRATDVPVESAIQAVLPQNRRDPLEVELHAHGSSTAFRDLVAERADMGMSSRPIKQAELEELQPMFGDLSGVGSEYVIALDGLAVIVHQSNPVMELSKREVAGLFAGEITDWSEVGGSPGKVTIYARDENSGTWDSFKSMVLKPFGAGLSASAERIESSTELSDKVAADSNGIGFIGLPYIRNARALGIAENSGGKAIVPTEFTVGTEDYPLARRLYFYVPANTDKQEIREFVEFTLSDRGQQIVREVGLVSQQIKAETVRPDPNAPADYLRLTRSAERLSINFRFVPGTDDRLDNKSIRDINRLVEFMRDNPGRAIILLGFTPSGGDKADNLEISRVHADIVADMLVARGLYPREVAGLGSAMPVASNDTELGRQKNRRVEIWLR